MRLSFIRQWVFAFFFFFFEAFLPFSTACKGGVSVCVCVFVCAYIRMVWMLLHRWAQISTRHIFQRPLNVPQGTGMWDVACWMPRRAFLIRFQETPNEACYKFFVNDVAFLPAGHAGTLRFDLDNCFQSPLAEKILHGLPMVEEVTIGPHFVTVRRVDDADADAAARYFAHKMGSRTDTPKEAARRSAALQQRVVDAMLEGDADGVQPPPTSSSSSNDHGEQGVTNSNGESSLHREDARQPKRDKLSEKETEEEIGTGEHVDEATLRDLLLSTHWSELKLHVSALLTDHLFSGRPHVDPDAPHPHPDTLPQEGDSEVVLILKELISTTIRPQLQLDGGDIRFVSLEGGVMYVEMLGACRRCKSSKTTLSDLIERTTRHWVPEVHEVREAEQRKPPHKNSPRRGETKFRNQETTKTVTTRTTVACGAE
ncbi:hypothetical protein, conserved [Trypanosoma cruzi]|uniref:Scaffold protein Nfu/NifU N-terminal domain-containing protein n=2 Tax=Trypanosoma cruzi TaxID=5693 RepID=Q4DZR1_TRYCC|nr:hypothetical protein, conserved [Trypanosoma cruzi]EAN98012.1 hypothetical protein, conserved [Trypanosoma cruzi]|eukprot:XP_819863.1 hypothetical protein [Trypanosoma cruzi strain CL Brener]